MIDANLFKTVLIQLSLFACGAALVATALLAWRRPKRWLWYAMVKAGLVGTVGTVLVTILLKVPEGIPLTDPGEIYAASLVVASVGLVGVSRDISRKAGRRTGAGDPKGTIGVLDVDEDSPELHDPLEERYVDSR